MCLGTFPPKILTHCMSQFAFDFWNLYPVLETINTRSLIWLFMFYLWYQVSFYLQRQHTFQPSKMHNTHGYKSTWILRKCEFHCGILIQQHKMFPAVLSLLWMCCFGIVIFYVSCYILYKWRCNRQINTKRAIEMPTSVSVYTIIMLNLTLSYQESAECSL